MKRIVLISLFLAVISFAAHDASAQNSVGVNVGYNLDVEEFFAGGQLRFGLGGLPVIINPSLETYFIDNFTWLQIDVNALYPFGVDNTTFTPYAGAGIGIDFLKPENGDSNTEVGPNLLAGATFGFGRLRPFVEARININDGANVGVRGGLLIGI